MKKIFRALTLCLVLLSLLCAAVPAAFAAGNKEDTFYTIGLDACGGVSSTVVLTTNLDGKLTTLPESPTMDGTTNKLLDGAEFELADGETKLSFVKDANGNYRVAAAGEDGATTTITVKGGKVNIYGLAGKTYTLTETKAPDGYNKLVTPETVNLTEGSKAHATFDADVYKDGGVVVKNNAGTVLPSTGGMGTTLFYVIGGGLMVAAVVLLVTKKRMEHKN